MDLKFNLKLILFISIVILYYYYEYYNVITIEGVTFDGLSLSFTEYLDRGGAGSIIYDDVGITKGDLKFISDNNQICGIVLDSQNLKDKLENNSSSCNEETPGSSGTKWTHDGYADADSQQLLNEIHTQGGIQVWGTNIAIFGTVGGAANYSGGSSLQAGSPHVNPNTRSHTDGLNLGDPPQTFNQMIAGKDGKKWYYLTTVGYTFHLTREHFDVGTAHALTDMTQHPSPAAPRAVEMRLTRNQLVNTFFDAFNTDGHNDSTILARIKLEGPTYIHWLLMPWVHFVCSVCELNPVEHLREYTDAEFIDFSLHKGAEKGQFKYRYGMTEAQALAIYNNIKNKTTNYSGITIKNQIDAKSITKIDEIIKKHCEVE